MMKEIPSKISAEHRSRKAIVYLRQSSAKQVERNLESQRLQYAIAGRARELGFVQVETIDCDLGCSAGLGAARRAGFDSPIAAVARGEVGIVLSREVSRLSRTDKDWCRLLVRDIGAGLLCVGICYGYWYRTAILEDEGYR